MGGPRSSTSRFFIIYNVHCWVVLSILSFLIWANDLLQKCRTGYSIQVLLVTFLHLRFVKKYQSFKCFVFSVFWFFLTSLSSAINLLPIFLIQDVIVTNKIIARQFFFPKNYLPSDSHTNTVSSACFAYPSRWRQNQVY